MKRIKELKDAIRNAFDSQEFTLTDEKLIESVESHVKDYISQKLAAAYFLEFQSAEDVVTFLIEALEIKRLKMASEFITMARQTHDKPEKKHPFEEEEITHAALEIPYDKDENSEE